MACTQTENAKGYKKYFWNFLSFQILTKEEKFIFFLLFKIQNELENQKIVKQKKKIMLKNFFLVIYRRSNEKKKLKKIMMIEKNVVFNLVDDIPCHVTRKNSLNRKRKKIHKIQKKNISKVIIFF